MNYGMTYTFLRFQFSRDKYDARVLRKMLDYGARTDVSSESKDTLFIQACAVCDLEDLKLFIEHGANIHELDKRRQTNGLYEAVWHKRPKKVIEYLIELGLDVNNTHPGSKKDWTSPIGTKEFPAQSVLDIAIEKGDREIIELLKSHGAKAAAEINGQS